MLRRSKCDVAIRLLTTAFSPRLPSSVSVANVHSEARRILSKRDWEVHQDLSAHVRESLSENKSVSEEFSKDTGFSLVFLGTGAGRLSVDRSNSATALRMGSTTYLFDAGEGVQSQLMLSKLKIGDVQRIFITHLHADHIFGLPGLLLSLQQTLEAKGSKTDKTKPAKLEIYGPVGLYNFITVSLSLSMTELRKASIIVFELFSNKRQWMHPGSKKHYDEFQHRGVRRKIIPQNPDGTWTLCRADEIDSPEKAIRNASTPSGMHVLAAEIKHVPKVQCFGYMVQEPQTQPRNIDVTKAKSLGVAPGSNYKLLKSGFSVMSDDGLRKVDADLVATPPIGPRKVVVLGDCFEVPPPMAALCQGTDIIVHEATFCNKDKGDKVEYGGHATAAMAGRFANSCRPQVLALNHISPALSHSNELVATLSSEAQAALDSDVTKVQVAYDFLELQVPRGGFQFHTSTSSIDKKSDDDSGD